MNKLFIVISFLLLPLCVKSQLNTERLTSIGRNALYFEDYVLSIQYFNQVIKAKPFLSEAYFYRAIAKIQLEDYVGAKQDLDRVIELNPFIPMAYYARGFSRRRLDDFVGAREDFTLALEYSPENPLYIINRIEVYEQLKEYDESINDIDFLIKRSPNEGGFHLEKARVLLSKGDTTLSGKSFYKAVEVDSLDADMWGALAYYMMIEERQDSALVCYDKSVDFGTKNISTFINRGVLRYKRKNYRGALDDYDVAVKLDPYNTQALYNRALLRTEVGDYDNAQEDLQNILKLEPDFSEALYQSAVINIELKQWYEAIDKLTSIIERHKYFAPAYMIRADVYDKIGKSKKAYLDRMEVSKLEKEYRNSSKAVVDSMNTKVQISNQYNSVLSDKSTIFLANVEDEDNKKSSIRGTIQNSKIEVASEKNFQLSYYYFKSVDLPQNKHLNRVVQEFNERGRLNAPLYVVNREVSLSNSLVDFHFSSINQRSAAIMSDGENGEKYFARGMDFALVKDFANAINDFSKAIFYGEDMVLAYFMRANVRYKTIEVAQNKLDLETNVSDRSKKGGGAQGGLNIKPLSADKKYAMEYEMVMRDYEMVIELAPDFPYAWFNKANLLSAQKDYDASIEHYNQAIRIYPDFGEAYFNRGLTYLMLDKLEEAVLDLSKAGELGVFQAYSIIKRITKD